jgi:hypothetical protein
VQVCWHFQSEGEAFTGLLQTSQLLLASKDLLQALRVKDTERIRLKFKTLEALVSGLPLWLYVLTSRCAV